MSKQSEFCPWGPPGGPWPPPCACACTDLDVCIVTRKIKDCGEFGDQAPVFGPVLRPQCGLKTGTTRALQTVSRGLCLSPPLRLLGKHVFQACVSRRITPVATSASLHRFLLEDVLMRTLYMFACRPRRSSGCTKRLLGNPAQALKLVACQATRAHLLRHFRAPRVPKTNSFWNAPRPRS